MNFRVALLQLAPGKNCGENFCIAKTGALNAKNNGADLILLPELWNVGYSSPEEYEQGRDLWERSAITPGLGEFTLYQNLAVEAGLAVVFPYLEKIGAYFSDSAALIDRKGNVLFNYRKVHTVDKGWESMLIPGESFPVAELETMTGSVRVGCMICYDREFPETARMLMLNGSEVILIPNACFVDLNRLHQLQTRGFENMIGVAMTNYPSPKYNGRSVAYDGMRSKGCDYDPLIVIADDRECIVYADFDMNALRLYRKTEIWGDAYRKPRLYGSLCEDHVKPPFLRKDARR